MLFVQSAALDRTKARSWPAEGSSESAKDSAEICVSNALVSFTNVSETMKELCCFNYFRTAATVNISYRRNGLSR